MTPSWSESVIALVVGVPLFIACFLALFFGALRLFDWAGHRLFHQPRLLQPDDRKRSRQRR